MASKVVKFASLGEFIDYANRETDCKSRESHSTYDAAWSGTKTYEDAVALSNGWVAGAKKIEKARVLVAPKGKAVRREVVMREAGPGVVSMGHYMAGHPQPYAVIKERNQPRNGKGKVVHVMVNISASSNVKRSVIERRGAAIVALVDALQAAGRRVEVTAVEAINYSGNHLEYHITVKRAQDRLNLPTLAFALAHPAMLRRIVFAANESEGHEFFTEWVGFSYGMPADVHEKNRPTDCLYLGAMKGWEPNWESDARAERWVTETCAAQGVTLK